MLITVVGLWVSEQHDGVDKTGEFGLESSGDERKVHISSDFVWALEYHTLILFS